MYLIIMIKIEIHSWRWMKHSALVQINLLNWKDIFIRSSSKKWPTQNQVAPFQERKRIEKKNPTAPHAVTVCQLTLPFFPPRHVINDAFSNGICFVPAEHVTAFRQWRYELRKAHFRPIPKSQQGLLPLLLLQLLSLFFIVIAHFLSPTFSFFLSQNFPLFPIPPINSIFLAPSLPWKHLFLVLMSVCVVLSLIFCCCFCNYLWFLNWFDFLPDYCIELLYAIPQSLIRVSDIVFLLLLILPLFRNIFCLFSPFCFTFPDFDAVILLRLFAFWFRAFDLFWLACFYALVELVCLSDSVLVGCVQELNK